MKKINKKKSEQDIDSQEMTTVSDIASESSNSTYAHEDPVAADENDEGSARDGAATTIAKRAVATQATSTTSNQRVESVNSSKGPIVMTTTCLNVGVDVIDPRFSGDATPNVEYTLTTRDYDAVIANEANPTIVRAVDYDYDAAKELADMVETYCVNTTLRYVDLKRFRQLGDDEIDIVHTAISNLQGSPLAASNDTLMYQLWADRSSQFNKAGLLEVDSDAWANAQSRLIVDDFIYDTDAPYTGKDLIVRLQLVALAMVASALGRLTNSDLTHPWLFADGKVLDVTQADLTLVTANPTPSAIMSKEILPVDIPTPTNLIFKWNTEEHAPVTQDEVKAFNLAIRKIVSQFDIKNGRLTVNAKSSHTSAVSIVRKIASTYAQKILHIIIRPSVYDGRNYLVINRLLAKTIFTMLSYVVSTTTYVENLQALFTEVDKTLHPTTYHSGLISALLKIHTYAISRDIDLTTPGKVIVNDSWDVARKTFLQSLHICNSAQPAVAQDALGDPEWLHYEYDILCQTEYFAHANAYHAQRYVYYRTRRDVERDIELVSRGALAALVSDDILSASVVENEIAKVDSLYTSAVMFFRTLEDADLKGLTSFEIQRIEQLTKSSKLVETLPNFASLHSLSAKTFARTSSLHVDTTTDLLKLSESNASRLLTKHMETVALKDVYDYVPTEVSDLASAMGASYIKMVGDDAIYDPTKDAVNAIGDAIDKLQCILKYVETARMHDIWNALEKTVHFDMGRLFYQLYTIISTDDNSCDAIANGSYTGALTVSARAGDITVMRQIKPLASAVGVLADIKLTIISAAVQEVLQTVLYVLAVHATHVHVSRLDTFDRTAFLWSDRLYQTILRDVQYPLDLQRALTFVRELAGAVGFTKDDLTRENIDWSSIEALGKSAYESGYTLTGLPYQFRSSEQDQDPYGYVRVKASLTDLINAISASTLVDMIKSGAWHSMLTQLDIAKRSEDVSSVIRFVSPKPANLHEKAEQFKNYILSLPDTQGTKDDGDAFNGVDSDDEGGQIGQSALPKMYVLSSLEKKLIEMREGDAFDALTALLGDAVSARAASHHQRALAFSTRFVDAVGTLTNWFKANSARVSPIKKAFFSTLHVNDISTLRFGEKDTPVDRLIKHKLLSTSGLYSQQRFMTLPLVTTSALEDLTLVHLTKRVIRCQLAYALLDDLSNTHLTRVAARAGSQTVCAYDVLRALNCDPDYRLTVAEARAFVAQLAIVNQRLRSLRAAIVAGGGATAKVRILFTGAAIPSALSDTDYLTLADTVTLCDPSSEAYIDVYTNSLVEGLYAFTLVKKHHQSYVLTGERSARFGIATHPIQIDAALFGDYNSLPESELPYGTVEKLLTTILDIKA